MANWYDQYKMTDICVCAERVGSHHITTSECPDNPNPFHGYKAGTKFVLASSQSMVTQPITLIGAITSVSVFFPSVIGKMVRCIDAEGTDGELVEGEIYEVLNQYVYPDQCKAYSVKSQTGYTGDWYAARFELVNSKQVIKPLSLECPCGISRKDCDYHR